MKLLLLDKDGTLVQPKSGSTFVQSPDDQELFPGVAETLDRYVNDGWTPVIVSNQGGVAAGHKTLDNAIAEMRYCMELLPAIRSTYFCPDFKGETCIQVWRNAGTGEWESASRKAGYRYLDFRKPQPGMLKLAVSAFIGVKQTLMIGDRPEDEGAAANASIPFLSADEWRSV